VFPRADRPIAVEFPGYPVVRLRPILLELAGRGGSVPPLKRRDPPYPPLIGGPKRDPPMDPPRISKSSISKGMSHELGQPKRREFWLELGESRRIVPEWTSIRTLGHRRGSRGAMRLLPRDRGGRAGVPQGGPADCGRVPRLSRRQVSADPVRTCREGGSVPPSKGGTPPLYPPLKGGTTGVSNPLGCPRARDDGRGPRFPRTSRA
jgi:hypothetical protein